MASLSSSLKEIIPYTYRELEGEEKQFILDMIKGMRSSIEGCGTHICHRRFLIDNRIYQVLTTIDGTVLTVQECIPNEFKDKPNVGTSNRDLFR
jgi:hypothetical protein